LCKIRVQKEDWGLLSESYTQIVQFDLPVISDLEEALSLFHLPIEARKKCEFMVQDDWKKTDDGFLAWEHPLHNTGGFDKS
jgi:hypothetical protein